MKNHKGSLEISLADNKIGDVGAGHMLEALKTDQNLKSISLAGNKISIKATVPFMEEISKHKTIKKVIF